METEQGSWDLAGGTGVGSASRGMGGRAAKSLKQLLRAQRKRINEVL